MNKRLRPLFALSLLSTTLAIATSASANEVKPNPFPVPEAVKQCRSVVDNIVNFLTKEKGRFESYVLTHEGTPNARMLSATLVSETQGERDVVHIAVSPTLNGCDAIYTQTILVPSTCSVFREAAKATFKPVGQLADVPLLRNEAGVSMISLDVNQACLVMRSETVYFDQK